MIRFSLILVTLFLSSQVFGQLYYSLGLKTQRVNFLYVYEGEPEYSYDDELNTWGLTSGIDSIQSKFISFGPTLCYGYHYDITDQIAVAGELEGFLGLLNVPGDRFYFDFGLGVRGSYTLNSSRYSNVFLRLGVGYGMNRGYSENDVIGLNWRLGYEHDFDNFLLGFALDGNAFVEDLSYYATVNADALIGRKLNSIGVVVYFSIGKL